MPHESADSMDLESLATAVRYIGERYRAKDRPLELLVEEVALERFYGCVTSANESRSTSILAGLKLEVARQVSVLVTSGDSTTRLMKLRSTFPASDAPAWVGHKPSKDS